MKSWTLVAIALLVFVLVPFAVLGERTEEFISAILRSHRGPEMAVFLIGVLILDVVLPVPSSLMSSYACQQFGPIGGLLIIFTGMSGAFVLAYLMGRSMGTRGVETSLGALRYQRAYEFGHKRGAIWALALSRAVPVLCEGIGLLAGALHWPWGKALLWTCLANLGVASAYAAFFALLGTEAGAPIVLLASAIIPALGMLVGAIAAKRASRV